MLRQTRKSTSTIYKSMKSSSSSSSSIRALRSFQSFSYSSNQCLTGDFVTRVNGSQGQGQGQGRVAGGFRRSMHSSCVCLSKEKSTLEQQQQQQQQEQEEEEGNEVQETVDESNESNNNNNNNSGKNKGKSHDDIVKEQAVKKSLKTTIWQMFLVTFLGSSVLNIMRERNYIDELSDNYRTRESLMLELIDSLEVGDVSIEGVREKLSVMNIRFEFFGLPISSFTGVEGLNLDDLKEKYIKVKGIDKINELRRKHRGGSDGDGDGDDNDGANIEVTQEIKDAIERSSSLDTSEKTHLGKFI